MSPGTPHTEQWLNLDYNRILPRASELAKVLSYFKEILNYFKESRFKIRNFVLCPSLHRRCLHCFIDAV